MKNFKRFFQVYIRPMWFRMLVVILLAGITSSYFFILGFITKLTVDHVLQIKVGSEVVPKKQRSIENTEISSSNRTTVLSRNMNRGKKYRDPQRVPPLPGFQAEATRKKSKSEQMGWLWVIFFSYLTIRLIFSGLNWFYSFQIAFIGQRMVFRIRLDLHEKIQKLQLVFFDRHQTGKIMSRILDDVGLLQNEVTTTFVDSVRYLAQVFIGIAILMTINLKLALLTLVALPFYVITYRIFKRSIRANHAWYRDAYANAYGIMEERVKGVQVVNSFAREKGEIREFFQRLTLIFRIGLRAEMLSIGLSVSCATISVVATSLTFYWGALSVKSGVMSVGDLLYFYIAMGHLFDPIVELTNMNAVFQRMMVVIYRVFEVLDEEIKIDDSPNSIRLNKIHGRIAFQNLSFRYTEEGEDVLKDLTFEIKPGTSVAVVGSSGSGKSTLVSLLLRLYEPTGGTLLLDDYKIQDIRLSSLRKNIGMVPQEPVLFSGTIAENIVYGRDGATPDEIMNAAKSAELHDYILELPEKYEARVGERGINFSGGQKQRLGFAMALLTNPSLLILDDTTSALDSKTEFRIQQTLENIMQGRTTIVITHRVSTAMRADNILVLEKGRLTGWGTHEDLIGQEGLYRQIYENQIDQKTNNYSQKEVAKNRNFV